ncbi:type II/IV secretion system protein [Rhodobacter sp. NTK016B]|uniref:GspE/PulE family protein n=1 Tax=Rhodobacter sp. NTK016B TaxID=2759676 RepID=UPI001A8F71F4|nr:GspE/PulE family protein [Rhodobacter sp. NTK016B]MBN8292961.1 type II/IV secretion system protein [Rhodobacter sp. NTK016B]
MSGARLPLAFARDNQVALDDAMLLAGPEATMNGLRAARRAAGAPLAPDMLDQDTFQHRLSRLYDSGTEEGEEVAFDLEDNTKQTARDILEDPDDAPVIRLVNQLLRQAVRGAASDLHLEPHESGLRARIRIDGTMQTVFDRRDVPAKRVVSRLKVMSGLDIAETRLPQDGRIALRLGGRAIDVRLSTLPGHHGERVVMRLLDRSGGLMELDRLGLSAENAARLNRLAALPNGIILATGPTGSGKTTTLYSLLRLADRRERTILTVEDPVEYDLPGISQTPVNPDIGLTFARGLRSILRQDPDVILVGEIRDSETAQTASEAALTGHLVFSSLHANTALSAVVRLRELGVEGYLISATLRGVLAQRLVRRLCPKCARAEAPTPEEAALFRLQNTPVPAQIHHAQGCEACDSTGFSGRVGVYDILEIDEKMRAAIDADASEVRLREAAGERPSLMQSALALVAEGQTSLAEVRRVLGESA